MQPQEHRPLFRNARLYRAPEHWSQTRAGDWFTAWVEAWNILTAHALDRLEADGWRRLGLGAVHTETPGFRALAEPAALAWATIDERDGWQQSILDIAKRQKHWFTTSAHRALCAADASRFELYFVRRARSSVELRRFSDGERFFLNAALDGGAYPDGAYVIARVAHDRGATISLASVVLPRETVRDLAGGSGVLEPHPTWLDIGIERLTQMACAARGDLVEPIFHQTSPAALRRLSRAFEALGRIAAHQGLVQQFCEIDGVSVSVEMVRGQLDVRLRSGTEIASIATLPPNTCSSVDIEMSFQAGRPAEEPIPGLRRSDRRPVTTSDVDRAASLLARTALHLAGQLRRAA